MSGPVWRASHATSLLGVTVFLRSPTLAAASICLRLRPCLALLRFSALTPAWRARVESLLGLLFADGISVLSPWVECDASLYSIAYGRPLWRTQCLCG